MEDNVLFLATIFVDLFLSGFNILYFKNGKLKNGSLKKKFNLIEFLLLVFIIIFICCISKLEYQVNALLISLVIYLVPLAEINFIIYSKNKRIELILSGLVFWIIIAICIYALVHGFL